MRRFVFYLGLVMLLLVTVGCGDDVRVESMPPPIDEVIELYQISPLLFGIERRGDIYSLTATCVGNEPFSELLVDVVAEHAGRKSKYHLYDFVSDTPCDIEDKSMLNGRLLSDEPEAVFGEAFDVCATVIRGEDEEQVCDSFTVQDDGAVVR